MHAEVLERTIVTRHAGSRCAERKISIEARNLVLRHHDRVDKRPRGRLALSLSPEKLERLTAAGMAEEALAEARHVVLVALLGRPPRSCICILTAFRRAQAPG